MHVEGGYWPVLHGQIPELEGHVVPAHDVATVMAEADV